MKIKILISNAVLLLVILAVAGCGSTSGSKIATTAPTASVNERGVNVPAATPVAAQEKVCENPAVGQDENLSGTEPRFPDLTEEYGGNDPMEGFNRSMFSVNKFGLKYFVQPIVIFWGSLIPKKGIQCFRRCADNIAFPRRTFSSLCQAKFKYAGIDTSRFLINVTLGIAGFYDPAFDWFDMEEQDEDFGQAFAVWGIGPGCVLHLPVLGPSNIRDGVGKIFDYAFDPKTYVPIPGVFGFTMLNDSAHRYRDIDTFFRANYDPYELLKRFYAAERHLKINDYDRKERIAEYQGKLLADEHEIVLPEPDPLLDEVVVQGFKSQGTHIDTLRVGMVDIQNDNKSMWVDLSLWNTDFFNQGAIRSVEVIKGKPEMPYKVWYQKLDDAPLAVVIPGFGTHFTSTHASAISEILFNQGYTVVILNSAFNWEFMSTAGSGPVPGYVPSDAEDVRVATAAVIKHLEGNGLHFQKKIMVGYSLGGTHALFIGAKEKADPKLKIDRFVAINPLVDTAKSVSSIDETSLAWKKWPREQIFDRGVFAAGKFITISMKQYQPYGEPELAQEINGTGTVVGRSAPSPAPATDETVQSGSGKEQVKCAPLPFSVLEAQVLISFNYKITLEEVIVNIVRNNGELNCFKNKCTWGNRTDFYREISQLSFVDYNQILLLKYHSDMEKRAVSEDEINKKSNLMSIEDFLRNEQNVFVIHSANDFLDNPEGRQWLRKTMGDRCVFYNGGGHLGELYFAGSQNKLASLAGELKRQTKKPDIAAGQKTDVGKSGETN
jgi:phospholipid-binding lipoprotein MlaA